MTFERDIEEKLQQDFGSEVHQAIIFISEALTQTDYLNHPRILRCIIFLAEGQLTKLENYLRVASHDPRDVIMLAEYANRGQEALGLYKRIRDFNKPLSQADL